MAIIRFNSHIGNRLILLTILLSFLCCLSLAPPVRADGGLPRRIKGGLQLTYFIFDNDYFGIDNGLGADLVLKYEIYPNIFFENRLGGYLADQEGKRIKGINGQLGVTVDLNYFKSVRPSVRGAIALLSADPVISEPVSSFRPSQTILYLVAGCGIRRTVKKNFDVEFGFDFLISPYKYRIYEFYRQYVETKETNLMHFSISLGVTYTF